MAKSKTPTAAAAPEKIDKRIANGMATRKRIIKESVAIAGSKGFAALTIGTLAEACGLSKSSMFTHFATREDLVIATLDAAYEEFDREVLEPCRESSPRDSLRVFFRRYFDYLNARHRSHACILTSSAFEFDGVHDKVRRKVVALIERRRSDLRDFFLQARDAGIIRGNDEQIEQYLFEYESLMAGFIYRYQLNPDRKLFERLVAGARRLFPTPVAKAPARALRAVR